MSYNMSGRVSYQQLEMLCDYLILHRDLAVGYNKSAHDRAFSRRHWELVTASLNSLGDGSKKSWKAWSKYWVDYKAKLRRKVRMAQLSTDGSLSRDDPLTEIERKFLSILGDGTGENQLEVQIETLDADESAIDSENEQMPSPTPSSIEIPLVSSMPPPPVSSHFSASRPSKRRPQSLSDSVLAKISNQLDDPLQFDRFDHMAKIWAETLRSVPNEQRIIAEKVINDVLYEAQLNTLTRESHLAAPK